LAYDSNYCKHLAPNTKRGGQEIKKEDLITIQEKENDIKLFLPNSVSDDKWTPDVPPIEIIDGQHRLWAFEKDEHLKENTNYLLLHFTI